MADARTSSSRLPSRGSSQSLSTRRSGSATCLFAWSAAAAAGLAWRARTGAIARARRCRARRCRRSVRDRAARRACRRSRAIAPRRARWVSQAGAGRQSIAMVCPTADRTAAPLRECQAAARDLPRSSRPADDIDPPAAFVPTDLASTIRSAGHSIAKRSGMRVVRPKPLARLAAVSWTNGRARESCLSRTSRCGLYRL